MDQEKMAGEEVSLDRVMAPILNRAMVVVVASGASEVVVVEVVPASMRELRMSMVLKMGRALVLERRSRTIVRAAVGCTAAAARLGSRLQQPTGA